MARGVRGSGVARPKTLSASQAEEMRQQLQAQLAELEMQDTRRFALIGRAVTSHAETDEQFAAELHSILDITITNRQERMTLGLTTTRRGGRRRKEPDAPGGAPAPVSE